MDPGGPGLAIFVGHAPGLAGTLEGLDSFNFALGLRDFDPRKHQPHPPGYPVIIGLGHLARPVAAAFSLSSDSGADARALALVSAVSGAVAVAPLFVLFRRLDGLGLPALARMGRAGAAGGGVDRTAFAIDLAGGRDRAAR